MIIRETANIKTYTFLTCKYLFEYELTTSELSKLNDAILLQYKELKKLNCSDDNCIQFLTPKIKYYALIIYKYRNINITSFDGKDAHERDAIKKLKIYNNTLLYILGGIGCVLFSLAILGSKRQ